MIERPEDTGVSNPYALAELIAGRRIKWASIRNRPKLLESIFGVAFDDIFDPSSGSPIFAAFREAWDLPEAPPAYRFPHEPTDANDLTASRRFSEVRNLADLTREIGLADPEALLVDDLKVVAPSRMRVELRWRDEDRTDVRLRIGT